MDVILVKYLHVLSSTFLFGTGVGTAFYLLLASRSQDVRVIAVVARYVVIADWIFTATTIVFQPLSGLYLAHRLGYPLTAPWLYWSIVLFVIAVGIYVKSLNALAKKTGEKIGVVTVDMGDTACKVPFAPDYIKKAEKRGSIGKKRKSARC